MTVFHRRFVGATELPKSLTDLDVEVLFRLSAQDVDAIRSRFRGDGRVGAALLLVFIRASGRPLARVAGVPRVLLQSLCTALSVNQTAIASLRSFYARESTLFEHQKWAEQFSGLVRVAHRVGRAFAASDARPPPWTTLQQGQSVYITVYPWVSTASRDKRMASSPLALCCSTP